MASNCDVQECTSSVKKRKIDYNHGSTLESNVKMEVNLFSDKFCTSTEILEGEYFNGGQKILLGFVKKKWPTDFTS